MATTKKRRKKKTPRNPADSYVVVQATAPPPAAPPDLATLPEDLHFNRERMFAIAAACRFERWLLEHIAARGIPRDDVNVPVTLLPIYVEAMLLARVKFPAARPPIVDDDEDGFWTPETEAEAAEVGLSVRRTRRGEYKPAADLPGCQGDVGTCTHLRRYGERFCSHHRRLELERMRRGR